MDDGKGCQNPDYANVWYFSADLVLCFYLTDSTVEGRAPERP